MLCASFAPIRAAHAQDPEPPNGLLLIAKASLLDPNFQRTVVLVTQAQDASTVGVILNRPTNLDVSRFFEPGVSTQNYREPVYFGGPVMRSAIVALLRSDSPPTASAFHVHKRVYLTMHPANIAALLQDPAQRYRLYAGFSGWAPGQLLNEFTRESWYVLAPDEDILFRKDTSGLWEELLARASGERAQFTRDPLSYAPVE